VDQTEQCGLRPVFVLDVLGRPRFAFEADTLAQAEELVGAPWFASALSRFWTRRGEEWNFKLGFCARTATRSEASIYQNFADEFAGDYSDSLFVQLDAAIGGSS
jgi:hypothetical protein